MTNNQPLKPISEMALHNPDHPFSDFELQHTAKDLAYSITRASNPPEALKERFKAEMIGMYVNNQNGRVTFTFAFKQTGRNIQVNIEHDGGPDLYNLYINEIMGQKYREIFREDRLYADMAAEAFNRFLTQ